MTDTELMMLRIKMRDPAWSLPRYGKIMGQKKQGGILYDPHAITNKLQETVLSYYSNTPRNSFGQTYWLVLLGARQCGKSLLPELCGYTKAAYNPGFEHVCIADNRERADYLHSRVHYTHEEWPEDIRTPTAGGRHEVRQKTFDVALGGKMRVLSGHAGAVGIGQSPDSFHGSELPYHKDAETQFSLIYPSMDNRDDALFVLESTASPSDAPSFEWWRDQYKEAKHNMGDWGNRWLSAFFPYWDGLLNQRPWPDDARLESDEINLLARYGYEATLSRKIKEKLDRGGYTEREAFELVKARLTPGSYLSKDNLAFRRMKLATDKAIRRNPELFWVYFPKDDLSCWLVRGNSVIHASLLKKHERDDLIEWEAPYTEYEAPEPGAQYVLGVDPVGFAARDHAAIQVLKVWDNEWTQVATYAAHTNPLDFAPIILDIANRYNKALVVVESNGVGTSVIALLLQQGYRRLYYEKPYKAGLTSTGKSVDQMLSYLQDGLKDELVMWDKDTVHQLKSYRHDKRTERAPNLEILNPRGSKARRDRHHWDKISALMFAVWGARSMPRRIKPGARDEEKSNVIPFGKLTYNQVLEYRVQQAKLDKTVAGTTTARRTYRRKKKKR
jgi:hypothetical protein